MRTKRFNLGVLSAAVIVVLALGAGGGYRATHRHDEPAKQAKTTQQTTSKSKPKQTTSLAYNGAEGKNALELLQQHATVVTKDSSYGPYVDSINGVKGGTDGKYWTFYVNGAAATVGASAYTTKTGDKIEWKLQ